jgi:hypothetical protein
MDRSRVAQETLNRIIAAKKTSDLTYWSVGVIGAIVSNRNDDSLGGLSNNLPFHQGNTPKLNVAFHNKANKQRLIQEFERYIEANRPLPLYRPLPL